MWWEQVVICYWCWEDTLYYYINTNEIPGELSRENMISSHIKISCYVHMWKYQCCYGYIINGAFRRIKLFQWNGLVFHWCLYNKINNRTVHGHLEIQNLSSRVENISLVRCPHSWNIFQHSKINFVSPCGHVISSIYSINRLFLTAPFWISYWLNHVMESCIIITSSAMVDCILHQVYYFLIQHLWKMTGFDLQLHLRYRDSL